MPSAGAVPACLSATLTSAQIANRELPSAKENSPHACPQAPDRKVFGRICELGAAHRLWAIIGSQDIRAWPHEAQPVKDVWTGIIGVVVQDVVGGDAYDLAGRNVRAVLGEGIRAQRFAPEGHCNAGEEVSRDVVGMLTFV